MPNSRPTDNPKVAAFVPLKDGRPRPNEIEVMDWSRDELRVAVLCGCGLNETGWCNCGAFTPPDQGGRAPDGYVWKGLRK